MDIPVEVVDRNDLSFQNKAQVDVVSISKGGRFKLAFRSLFICWGATFFCAFIPVLHLFLVPAGLVFGIYLFHRSMTLEVFLNSGSIHCPKCKHDIHLPSKAFNWPFRIDCGECRIQILIRKKPEIQS